MQKPRPLRSRDVLDLIVVMDWPRTFSPRQHEAAHSGARGRQAEGGRLASAEVVVDSQEARSVGEAVADSRHAAEGQVDERQTATERAQQHADEGYEASSHHYFSTAEELA
uniref:Uncharacterized protein n=1 Tax=Macrostomum lignano TaxID=282301 RepID=A0A1I8HKY8_9PLAT